MLAWVICTAFGDPVEPDVNCISATSSSQVSTGSIGALVEQRPRRSAPVMPSSASTGAAGMNGSETTTAVGVDHVDDARWSPRPSAPGRCAEWAGAAWSGWRRASRCPARSGRSRPGRRPAPRRRHRVRRPPRPAHRRPGGPARAPRPRYAGPARRGSPVTMPLRLHRALRVHRLGKSAHDNPFGLGEITTRVCCVGNPARICGRARNFGSRWGSTVVEPCRASTMSTEVRDSFCSPQIVRRSGRSDMPCMSDGLTVQIRRFAHTGARRRRPGS